MHSVTVAQTQTLLVRDTLAVPVIFSTWVTEIPPAFRTLSNLLVSHALTIQGLLVPFMYAIDSAWVVKTRMFGSRKGIRVS